MTLLSFPFKNRFGIRVSPYKFLHIRNKAAKVIAISSCTNSTLTPLFICLTGIVSLISGHFTQVVWEKSTELGIAYATYKDGEWNKVVVVGNYYPAGNVTSQFEENVKQAKKDTKNSKNSKGSSKK